MARFVSDIFPPASSRSVPGDTEAGAASKRQSLLPQAGVLLLEPGKPHQRQEPASEHPQGGGCSGCLELSCPCSSRTCCPCLRPMFLWQTVACPRCCREQSKPGDREPGANPGMLAGGLEVVLVGWRWSWCILPERGVGPPVPSGRERSGRVQPACYT